MANPASQAPVVDLVQSIPQDRFEFADVTFTAADTDVVIPYSRFRPVSPDDIRWLDISPSAVNVGGVDTLPRLYKSALPSRKLWARGYIVLRSSVAGYSTRLQLFAERKSTRL
jgi:hypothetical protein